MRVEVLHNSASQAMRWSPQLNVGVGRCEYEGSQAGLSESTKRFQEPLISLNIEAFQYDASP